MAKNTQPIAKRCKALGISPAVMGYAKKNTTRNSNGNFRKKKSEYATQMQEKQKLKFIYGVLEKQFSNYFEEASRRQGQAGENLLQFLGRLDDIGQPGIELIETIHDMFLNYPDIDTQIIAASVRNPIHVTDCALAGADIATVPYKVIEQMLHHPLTDAGIEKFKADYIKVFGE